VPDPSDLLPLPSQDFQVLLTLSAGPLHAYALTRAVENEEAGVRLELGSLYRILARLTTLGVIEDLDVDASAPGSESRRRLYKLTPFGRKVAQAEGARLQAVVRLARRQNLVPAKGAR